MTSARYCLALAAAWFVASVAHAALEPRTEDSIRRDFDRWLRSLGPEANLMGQFGELRTWREAGGKKTDRLSTFGFLRQQSKTKISILRIGLEPYEVSQGQWEHFAFHRVDLKSWLVANKEKLANSVPFASGWAGPLSVDQGVGYRFRTNALLLTGLCDIRGYADLANEFYAKTNAVTADYGEPQKLSAQVAEDDIFHRLYLETLGPYFTWDRPKIEVADRLAFLAQHFPNAPQRENCLKDAAIFRQMAKEEKTHRKLSQVELARLVASRRAVEFVWELRNQAGFNPAFNPNVFMGSSLLGRPEEAASELVEMGSDAVPALLGALHDIHPTLGVDGIGYPGQGRVIRVRDLAVQTLEAIATVRFVDPMKAYPADNDAAFTEVETKIRRWWDDTKRTGREAALIARISGTEQSVSEPCARLINEFPNSAFKDISSAYKTSKGAYERAEMLSALWESKAPEVRGFAKTQMSEDPEFLPRLAAMQVVDLYDADAAVAAMVKEVQNFETFRQLDLLSQRIVLKYLAQSGQPEAIKGLRRIFDRLLTDQRVDLIDILDRHRPRVNPAFSKSPVHEDYAACSALAEELLVHELSDTERVLNFFAEDHGYMTRPCDHANARLARLWPKRYTYNLSASQDDLDRQRRQSMVAYRKDVRPDSSTRTFVSSDSGSSEANVVQEVRLEEGAYSLEGLRSEFEESLGKPLSWDKFRVLSGDVMKALPESASGISVQAFRKDDASGIILLVNSTVTRRHDDEEDVNLQAIVKGERAGSLQYHEALEDGGYLLDFCRDSAAKALATDPHVPMVLLVERRRAVAPPLARGNSRSGMQPLFRNDYWLTWKTYKRALK